MLSTIAKVTIRRVLSGYKKLLVTLLISAISFPVSAQLLSASKILLTFSGNSVAIGTIIIDNTRTDIPM